MLQKTEQPEANAKDWKSKPPRLAQYANSTHDYKGYGTGPPAGPKRYKSNDELVTPPHGTILGTGGSNAQLLMFLRLTSRIIFVMIVFSCMIGAYSVGLTFLRSDDGRFAIGLYGALFFGHISFQLLFALLLHRKVRMYPPPKDYEGDKAESVVALQISAYQEDPAYLYVCLESVMQLEYPRKNMKVVFCIDGNDQDSSYMVDIFESIVRRHGEEPVFFWWDYNFHELPEGLGDDENGVELLTQCIQENQFVCVMQKWGGKREVMYTAFRALGESVDYVQVCDSDTQLDPRAMLELTWVLDSHPHAGAVGGDVKILNEGDSFISFLSGLRYWMAFNLERACQGYFGCVSCISGPLGLYRMSVVREVLDLWSDQTFLGQVCTFGDDRHLTNRMLQLGHATLYTPRSFCYTETPSEYFRWLNQQIRWTKSYFREWLFNSLWWHKHSLWMSYESIVSGCFPFFVIATIIDTVYSGSAWGLLFVLLTFQMIGIVKGTAAALVRGNPVMLFMSFYSSLYITSLLPSKIFAILTITKKGWGTSGRKTILTSYNALIPLVVWGVILLGGTVYTLCVNDYSTADEAKYLSAGLISYALFWTVGIVYWKIFLRDKLQKKSDISTTDSLILESSDESKDGTTDIDDDDNFSEFSA